MKIAYHIAVSGPEARSPSRMAGSKPNSGSSPSSVLPVVGDPESRPSTMTSEMMPPT